MIAESSIVTKQQTYSGYDIIVATVGPIKPPPDETGSPLTHHKANISIWFRGKKIREACEAPSMLFVSREDAAEFGFEIGRMIVMQRCSPMVSKLRVRVRELFKWPQLLLRS